MLKITPNEVQYLLDHTKRQAELAKFHASRAAVFGLCGILLSVISLVLSICALMRH